MNRLQKFLIIMVLTCILMLAAITLVIARDSKPAFAMESHSNTPTMEQSLCIDEQ